VRFYAAFAPTLIGIRSKATAGASHHLGIRRLHLEKKPMGWLFSFGVALMFIELAFLAFLLANWILCEFLHWTQKELIRREDESRNQMKRGPDGFFR
jgi:uncharacterized membrane protein YhaH (DUF805 family)